MKIWYDSWLDVGWNVRIQDNYELLRMQLKKVLKGFSNVNGLVMRLTSMN